MTSDGLHSSVDFTVSLKDPSAVQANLPIRRRLTHKKSFSIPTDKATDFADVRCGLKGLGHYEDGIDLPFIQVGIARGELSRVTEGDERNESSLMRRTLDEMGPVLTALESSPSSMSTSSSRFGLSEFVPMMPYGGNSIATFTTDQEPWTEEMERELSMDTPTRSDFMISPSSNIIPVTEHQENGCSEIPPIYRINPEISVILSVTDTSSGSRPPASLDDLLLKTNVQPLASHPHPPPLQPSGTAITSNLVPVPGPHSPIQGLANKKSTETMRSDMTTTTYLTASPTPLPEFRPSREELMLVKEYYSRRGQSGSGVREDPGQGDTHARNNAIVRKEMRPLQLVDQNQKRKSNSLPKPSDKENIAKLETAGPRMSMQMRKKLSTSPAKLSTASGGVTKASKTSKTSMTSRGYGSSGLRV